MQGAAADAYRGHKRVPVRDRRRAGAELQFASPNWIAPPPAAARNSVRLCGQAPTKGVLVGPSADVRHWPSDVRTRISNAFDATATSNVPAERDCVPRGHKPPTMIAASSAIQPMQAR